MSEGHQLDRSRMKARKLDIQQVNVAIPQVLLAILVTRNIGLIDPRDQGTWEGKANRYLATGRNKLSVIPGIMEP